MYEEGEEEVMNNYINPDNNKLNEDEELIDNRTYLERTFGKMKPDSLRGAIFNLCILSLGSGCLAVPQKFGYMSLIISPFAIIIAGCINLWALILISSLYEKYKIKRYDLLVEKLYGKSLGILLSITMFINQFGILIIYQVIIYKLLGGIINEIGGFGYKNNDTFLKESFWGEYKWKFSVCYGITFIIILPLCLLKNVSEMRYTSTFGILSIILLILIVLIESPFFIYNWWNDGITKDKVNIFNIKQGFDKDMKFIKSITTLFYGFSCHVGAFPIISSLKNPTRKRVDKVFKYGMTLDIICYLIIGFCGYLSQPIDTPDLIIERTKIFENDFLMNIAQICFILAVFTKISANYNAYRVVFLSFFNIDLNTFSNKINFILTFCTLSITTFISIVFQSISDYLSFIGSFCTVIISYLIPGLLYIKGNKYPKTHYKNIITTILLCILCPIGLSSGIFTIQGIVNKTKK